MFSLDLSHTLASLSASTHGEPSSDTIPPLSSVRQTASDAVFASMTASRCSELNSLAEGGNHNSRLVAFRRALGYTASVLNQVCGGDSSTITMPTGGGGGGGKMRSSQTSVVAKGEKETATPLLSPTTDTPSLSLLQSAQPKSPQLSKSPTRRKKNAIVGSLVISGALPLPSSPPLLSQTYRAVPANACSEEDPLHSLSPLSSSAPLPTRISPFARPSIGASKKKKTSGYAKPETS